MLFLFLFSTGPNHTCEVFVWETGQPSFRHFQTLFIKAVNEIHTFVPPSGVGMWVFWLVWGEGPLTAGFYKMLPQHFVSSPCWKKHVHGNIMYKQHKYSFLLHMHPERCCSWPWFLSVHMQENDWDTFILVSKGV